VTTPRFVFLVARQPGEGGPPRLGLVVSRKVGAAVHRNRVKRLCRECFRQLPDLLPPAVDLVVIAKPEAPRELAFADVHREWSKARPAIRRKAEEALARPADRHHVSARPSSSRKRGSGPEQTET
jgi:ribonuclease P protein component